MKVKAIDIANELGLSKATVSLALNDKPGVNPKTKQLILECKARMETGIQSGTVQPKTKDGYIIKLLLATRDLKIAKGAELDLWTDVNDIFSGIAKSWNCMLEILYYDILRDSTEIMIKECNKDNILGVIVFGTEVFPSDSALFSGIKKPIVFYDTDMENDRYPCVVINNIDGVKKSIDYLVKQGKRNIIYLSRNLDIYNYLMRRKGFVEGMKEHNLYDEQKKQILTMGDKIDRVYDHMKEYLENHSLPDAFIMESYHLSIGSIRAFRDKGINIPHDVSIIGIDELPEYMLGEYQMTTIRIPHTERAKLTMQLLWHEIYDGSNIKSKIYTNCKLIEGATVD